MGRGGAIRVAAAGTFRRVETASGAMPVSETKAPASPARVHFVLLERSVSAAHACCAVLALHGAAIGRNLQCVLTTLDPEGPHQLRIALRRTRVALRVFEPVMRRKVNTRLMATARALGRIVGELRDADVIIDEMITPAARGETSLLAALEGWRQEVRGRVRARLLAADAPLMAADFSEAAARAEWLKSDAQSADVSFLNLIDNAQRAYRERAVPVAARMAELSQPELHQLRKAVKAARYVAELGASAGWSGDVVPRLKRMQDALGYVNDTAVLEAFDPTLSAQAGPLLALRTRLVSERRSAAPDAIATAMEEWRALSHDDHAWD